MSGIRSQETGVRSQQADQRMARESSELQSALLKLDSYSADECMRLRSQVLILRIWMIAGWVLAVLMMWLAIRANEVKPRTGYEFNTSGEQSPERSTGGGAVPVRVRQGMDSEGAALRCDPVRLPAAGVGAASEAARAVDGLPASGRECGDDVGEWGLMAFEPRRRGDAGTNFPPGWNAAGGMDAGRDAGMDAGNGAVACWVAAAPIPMAERNAGAERKA